MTESTESAMAGVHPEGSQAVPQLNVTEAQKARRREQLLHLHEIATQHWIHAEQVRWTSLNNYLVASTIVLAVFGAIVATQSPRTAPPLLLIGLPVFGLAISFLWAGIGYRGSGFTDRYAQLGLRIEQELYQLGGGASFLERCAFHEADLFRRGPKKQWREKLRALITMHRLLLGVPALFAIAYLTLLIWALVNMQG